MNQAIHNQRVSFLLAAAIFLAACHETTPDQPDQALKSGGETTVENELSTAFEQPCTNLNSTDLERHFEGDVAFEAAFVTAPATVNSGLGPLFNQNNCAGCHGRNGRSPFPEPGSDLGGLLIRLSIPGIGQHGETIDAPGFGGQLQTKAVFGKQPEAQISIEFQEEIRQLVGLNLTLRKPVFVLQNPYAALPGGLEISPRLAPPVIGLGLLEAVPEALILQNEDPNDANADGISGRANRVWDIDNQRVTLGRFGWKAGQPNLVQQTAAAYSGDMGLTTSLFKTENSAGQPQADPANDDPEISDDLLKLTAFYTQSLAVPAPRNFDDATVIAGRKLFLNIGCANCHTPSFQTGNSEFEFLKNQQFFAYTDLLLHDMGAGLADNRPEFLATGTEWRTPPLWGIGLTKIINGHTNFLHDGRAASLLEAILWHGGEAENSRKVVEKMSEKERNALLKFLEAL